MQAACSESEQTVDHNRSESGKARPRKHLASSLAKGMSSLDQKTVVVAAAAEGEMLQWPGKQTRPLKSRP